jgi:hypothetical protein
MCPRPHEGRQVAAHRPPEEAPQQQPGPAEVPAKAPAAVVSRAASDAAARAACMSRPSLRVSDEEEAGIRVSGESLMA